jgi:hypothetical protein
MTTHRIIYHGPASLAVQTATMLANAEGIELASSEAPGSRTSGDVRLALTIKGSTDAIIDAVARIREGLPLGATITIGEETS